jgi:putative membrane protein
LNFLNRIFLAKELDRWQSDGIVDKETAIKIANLYDIDPDVHSDKISFVLKLVAYLFFALAFFTLVGANWEEIPRLGRLTLVLFVLGLVNFGGIYYLAKGKENLSTAMFFLGNFCFGAAIALIAQIYNISDEPSGGILLWSIGAFAVSFASKKGVLVAQSLIFATVWFFMIAYQGDFGFGFIIFIVLGAYTLYKDDSKWLAFVLFIDIFIYIISFCGYISGFRAIFDYGFLFGLPMVAIVSLSYALLLISISPLLDKFRVGLGAFTKEFGKNFGVFVLLFCLFLFEERNLFEVGDEELWFVKSFFKSNFGFVFILFSVAYFALFFKEKNKSGLLLGALLVSLPFVFSYGPGYANIFFSLANIITAAVLIKKGELKLGLCMIFLVAAVRYFQLIGDYIGATALFMVFAFIVLVVARKGRKK